MYIGGTILNFYILTFKNKFFVLTILFILSFLIILHITYFENFSHYVLKNDRSAKIFNFIKDNGRNIKIAAIGTSHTANGLTSKEETFFNYGAPSTWYPQVAYAKATHLLDYASNLKILLLEVDHISVLRYTHLLDTQMPEQYLYLLKHVNEPFNEKIVYTNTSKKHILLSLQSDIAPVLHRKLFQNYLRNRGEKKTETNSWLTLTSKEKREKAKKRIHSYYLDTPSKIDGDTLSYYNRIIQKAQTQNVQVYLIYYPQTIEYLSQINDKNNIIVENFVNELCKKYNIKKLDFRYFFENNESSFANQDHITKKASFIIFKEIAKDISIKELKDKHE